MKPYGQVCENHLAGHVLVNKGTLCVSYHALEGSDRHTLSYLILAVGSEHMGSEVHKQRRALPHIVPVSTRHLS